MKKLPITFVLVLLTLSLTAQKAVDVALGIGLPDLLHVTARAQLSSQTQLGIGIGRLPVAHNTNYSISADVYAHFGKQGSSAERKLWYYRGGFTRTSESEKVNKDIYTILNNRIGKDFYFSGRMGMSLDLGIAIVVDHHVKNKQETGGWLGGDLDLTPSVFPCGDLSLFYRF
jgi:hypothetical protein